MNRATPKYQATGVSSGQEAPQTASLSPTVLRVQHYRAKSECSMTWTKHDVLCSYTSYCMVALSLPGYKHFPLPLLLLMVTTSPPPPPPPSPNHNAQTYNFCDVQSLPLVMRFQVRLRWIDACGDIWTVLFSFTSLQTTSLPVAERQVGG